MGSCWLLAGGWPLLPEIALSSSHAPADMATSSIMPARRVSRVSLLAGTTLEPVCYNVFLNVV